MNKTHQNTLEAIFRKPVPVNLEWRRIESLFNAVGARTIEGNGSRVRFELNGKEYIPVKWTQQGLNLKVVISKADGIPKEHALVLKIEL